MRHIQTLCPLCAYHIGDVFAHSYFSGIDSALYSEDLSILSRMVGTLLSVVKSTMEIATHCNQPRMMRWKSLFIVTSKLQPQCRWCDMSQKGYIFYILAVCCSGALVPFCMPNVFQKAWVQMISLLWTSLLLFHGGDVTCFDVMKLLAGWDEVMWETIVIDIFGKLRAMAFLIYNRWGYI